MTDQKDAKNPCTIISNFFQNLIFGKRSFEQHCKYVSKVPGTNVCRWGSSQYALSQAVYDTMINGNTAQILKEFNINVELGKQTETQVAIKNIIKSYNSDYKTKFRVADYKSVGEIFEGFRNECLDLWTAIPMVFYHVWPDATVEVEKSGGTGPILNQIMQSNNNKIGLQAWLLVREKIIDNDACLCNFST